MPNFSPKIILYCIYIGRIRCKTKQQMCVMRLDTGHSYVVERKLKIPAANIIIYGDRQRSELEGGRERRGVWAYNE